MRFLHRCSAALKIDKINQRLIITANEARTGLHPVYPNLQEWTMVLGSFLRMIRVWRRYNESLRELSRLGDRELADIGINRSEISAVAWEAARR